MKQTWTHTTERYRYATRADFPAFDELLSDPEVGRWLWFTPLPPDGVAQFFGPLVDRQLEQLANGERPLTAVIVVEDEHGGFLGQGAVVEVPMSPNGFEIGFQLMQRAWGRGVGTRLGQFLCAYAIEYGGAFRIEGECVEGNAGSAALLTKLGLRLEGTRPAYRLKEETRHTALFFGNEVERLDTAAFGAVAEHAGMR